MSAMKLVTANPLLWLTCVSGLPFMSDTMKDLSARKTELAFCAMESRYRNVLNSVVGNWNVMMVLFRELVPLEESAKEQNYTPMGGPALITELTVYELKVFTGDLPVRAACSAHKAAVHRSCQHMY